MSVLLECPGQQDSIEKSVNVLLHHTHIRYIHNHIYKKINKCFCTNLVTKKYYTILAHLKLAVKLHSNI